MHLMSFPPTGGGLKRQRMYAGSGQSIGSSLIRVTGFASDSTFPAVVVSNALIVQGSGAVTVEARLVLVYNGGARPLQIRINNTSVAEVSTNAADRTVTYSGLVDEGDEITLWAQTVVARNVTSAYVDLTPA